MSNRSVVKRKHAHLTESQRRAVATIDRSVLVSAAAGSGKTTVLAERCAVIVCDLPKDQQVGKSRFPILQNVNGALLNVQHYLPRQFFALVVQNRPEILELSSSSSDHSE